MELSVTVPSLHPPSLPPFLWQEGGHQFKTCEAGSFCFPGGTAGFSALSRPVAETVVSEHPCQQQSSGVGVSWNSLFGYVLSEAGRGQSWVVVAQTGTPKIFTLWLFTE